MNENFAVLKMDNGAIEELTTLTSRVAAFSMLDDVRFQDAFVFERVENTNTWKLIKHQYHSGWLD